MYPFFGKNNRHARRLREQEERIRRFKAELKEEQGQFEKGDYLAMVIGAFWALWPVLAIVVAVILVAALFLFH